MRNLKISKYLEYLINLDKADYSGFLRSCQVSAIFHYVCYNITIKQYNCYG